MEERYIVEARRVANSRAGALEFLPVLLRHTGAYCGRGITPTWERVVLLRHVSEDAGYTGAARYVPTFEEAQLVATRHECGLGEDVRSASWDAVAGDWTDVEEDCRGASRGDQEDFHADG